jgi:hypothetical protein
MDGVRKFEKNHASMRVPSRREVSGGGIVTSEEIAMRWNAMGCACAVLGFCVAGVGELKAQMPVPPGATLVKDGLYGLHGLKFGPDGNL